MKLICECVQHQYSDGEEETWGLDYVVVDLSPEQVKLIQQQCELAHIASKRDMALCELRFGADEVAVYSHETLGDALEESWDANLDEFENEGWAILPEDFDLSPFQNEEYEMEWFCTSRAAAGPDAYFWWVIEPSDDDSREVTTKLVSLASLQEAIRNEEALRRDRKQWYLDAKEGFDFDHIEFSTRDSEGSLV